jgi:hypothetical protein
MKYRSYEKCQEKKREVLGLKINRENFIVLLNSVDLTPLALAPL